MTNFKGTKGKWEVYNSRFHGCKNVSIGNLDGFNAYVEIWYHQFENEEEANANALLISKAPEMLEMLENIEHKLRNGYNITSSDHTKILQLIKEATEV